MSAILHVRAIRQTACLVFVAWVVSSFAAVQAQKVKPPMSGPPKPVWPPAEAKFMADRKLAVDKIMTAGVIAPGDQTVLQEYFGTLVKGFTIKEVIPGLWFSRETMRKHAIVNGITPNNAAQSWLRQFLFSELQKIVADAKLPVESRVNALGAIGDLNEKEPEVKGVQLVAQPVPLVAATPYLLEFFTNSETPLFLRATALRGLHRHAELGVNPANRPALLAAMLNFVQEANVPKDCSPAAHEFMRRRAAQILGGLKDPSAAKPLIDVLNDAQASLAFRCDAARSLGMLTLKPGGDPAAGTAAVAQTLGELAATIAETETDRRVLHAWLDCARVGLNGPDPKVAGGVRGATPQAEAKLAGALFVLIDPYVRMIDPVASRSYKEDQLADDTTALAGKLREALPDVRVPAKAKEAEPAKTKESKTAEPAAKGKEAKTAEPKTIESKTAEPPKSEPAKTKDGKAP